MFKKLFKNIKGSGLVEKIMVTAFAVAAGAAVITYTSGIIIEAKNKEISGVLGEMTPGGFISASYGTEGLHYYIMNRTYVDRLMVTGYEGDSPTVIVPSTDGRKVKVGVARPGIDNMRETKVLCIGNGAFEGCDYVSSVTLPGSITSIANNAFADCYSLSSINIPSSVGRIGDYAFSECHSLTEIYIPSSVEEIGVDCFDGCSSNLVIRCGHASEPESFGGNWNGGHQVIWGV